MNVYKILYANRGHVYVIGFSKIKVQGKAQGHIHAVFCKEKSILKT